MASTSGDETQNAHEISLAPSRDSENMFTLEDDVPTSTTNEGKLRKSSRKKAPRKLEIPAVPRKSQPKSTANQRPKSEPQSDRETAGPNSSSNPNKTRKGHYAQIGKRCDRCIILRRSCDGTKPVCGRCMEGGKECKWHDEYISRSMLEKQEKKMLKDAREAERLKDAAEAAMQNPGKPKQNGLSENNVDENTGTATSQIGDDCNQREATKPTSTKRKHRKASQINEAESSSVAAADQTGEDITQRKAAIPKARKRKYNKMTEDNATGSIALDLRDQTGEDITHQGDITQQRKRRVRFDDQSADLRDGEDILRPDQPTTMNLNAPEPGTDSWTFKDHVETLDSLLAPHPEPITEAPVYGHKKGNKIFDRTTKALEDFDTHMDDVGENVPQWQYEGLTLNWSDDEDIQPEVALRNGGYPNFQTTLRERIGLPAYPARRVNPPLFQKGAPNAGRQVPRAVTPVFEEATPGMESSPEFEERTAVMADSPMLEQRMARLQESPMFEQRTTRMEHSSLSEERAARIADTPLFGQLTARMQDSPAFEERAVGMEDSMPSDGTLQAQESTTETEDLTPSIEALRLEASMTGVEWLFRPNGESRGFFQ